MVNSWLEFGFTLSAVAVAAVGVYYWGKRSEKDKEDVGALIPSTAESGKKEEEAKDEGIIPSSEESVAEEVDEDLTKPFTDESGTHGEPNEEMTQLSEANVIPIIPTDECGIHKEVDAVVIPLIEASVKKEAPAEMTKLPTVGSGTSKDDDEANFPSIKEAGEAVKIPSTDKSGFNKDDTVIPSITVTKECNIEDEFHIFLENENIKENNHHFIPRLMIRDSIRPYVLPSHHKVNPDRDSPETYLLVSNVPHWADPKSLERVLNEVSDSPVESIQFDVKERGIFAGTARVTFHDNSLTGKEMLPTKMGTSLLSMVWIIDDVPMIEQPRYIVITNLPNKTTEQELRKLLSPECNPKTIDIRTDEKDLLNCNATISFDSSDEAMEAEEVLDCYIFHGRYIRVQK